MTDREDTNGDGAMRAVSFLARANRGVALLCGVVLLVTVGLIIIEIALRKLAGGVLGGTDEVSGYVMAGISAWGFGYALLERAHVRIDLLHRRLATRLQSALDLFALSALASVAILVSYHGWRVLGTTLERGSRANTPLETPLWIPQSVWVMGWTWFALCAVALLVCSIILIAKGRRTDALAAIGLQDEVEAELENAS